MEDSLEKAPRSLAFEPEEAPRYQGTKEELALLPGATKPLLGGDKKPRTFDTATELGIPRLYQTALLEYWGPKAPIPALDDQRNLLILGANGVGKSCLAALVAMRWYAQWYSMLWLLMRYESRRGAYEDTPHDLLEEVTGIRAVVLDDFMRVRKTEAGLWMAYNVLNRRIENRLVTIVTSDKSLQEIDAIDPAIASRLASFDRIVLKGADRRLKT